jgi:hypothetical protein
MNITKINITTIAITIGLTSIFWGAYHVPRLGAFSSIPHFIVGIVFTSIAIILRFKWIFNTWFFHISNILLGLAWLQFMIEHNWLLLSEKYLNYLPFTWMLFSLSWSSEN